MPKPGPPEVRFFRYVELDASTGCWNWTAFKQRGYGQFAESHRKTVRAHRWSYEYFIATLPAGLHLDHLCRNPGCVNPWHLDPVTPRVNLMRAPTTFQARNAAKTHCPAGHPYDAENTIINSCGRRVCRTCERARWQVRKAKRQQAAA